DRLWSAFAVEQHVTTACDLRELFFASLNVRQVLTRQDQRGRTFTRQQCSFPGNGRFHGIGRTPYRHVGRVAQVGDLFNWLVGRAVLTLTNRVVGEYEDVLLLHQ